MKTIWDRRTLLVSSLGVLTPACSAPGAGDEQALRGLVRHRILDQHAALAAVVASLRNSHRSIISVRDPGAGEAYALGANTIFEIASLTKVFTALLLAVEVVHGRVGLDDPLQSYVPEGVTAPTFEGRQISLTDLATHGAALPLRPNNLAATAHGRSWASIRRATAPWSRSRTPRTGAAWMISRGIVSIPRRRWMP
jgi:CubicO group peptidase (beta-lactamase class C family)